MALVLANRVRETCTSPGVGTVTLQGAVTGFQSFAVIGSGNTTYYTISDQSGSRWEVGIGTYTSSGTTLSRDVILSSSNGTTIVNFNSGIQDVYVVYPSEKSVYTDASGNVNALGTVTSATWNGTTMGVAYGGTGQTTFTNGQLLIGNTTGNTLTKATLTQGTGITITNGAGSISIANSAPDQTVAVASGTGISVTGTYPNFTVTNTNLGSSQNIFKNVAVSGQNTIVADTNNDTLTVAAGTGVSLATDATTDTLTITNTDLGSSQNIFKNVAVSGQSTIVADTNNDTLTVVAGTGVSLTTNATTDTLTITNASPDQTVAIASGTGINVTGTYPSFTVANTDTGSAQNIFKNVAVSGQSTIVADTNNDTLTVVAGTGVSLTTNATTDTLTITNASPDQTVAVASGTGISVTGTYPNFTVTNTNLGSSQNIFKNVAVSGQSTVVADNNNDTLTLVAGTNVTITTDASTDSVTIASSGGGATGGGTDKIFIQNDQSVTTNYSIPSGQNAMSTGPITVNSGVTVTVPSGSRWVVL